MHLCLPFEKCSFYVCIQIKVNLNLFANCISTCFVCRNVFLYEQNLARKICFVILFQFKTACIYLNILKQCFLCLTSFLILSIRTDWRLNPVLKIYIILSQSLLMMN